MWKLWEEQQGQDLVEYSLVLGFIVLASAAAYLGISRSTSGLWNAANTRLGAANMSASS